MPGLPIHTFDYLSFHSHFRSGCQHLCRRVPTILSVVLFAIGFAISGSASTLGALIAGRAIQGIGCAGINTTPEVVVCDIVPLRERGKFMGLIFIFIYGISTTLGPVNGGVFASKASWRWIFT